MGIVVVRDMQTGDITFLQKGADVVMARFRLRVLFLVGLVLISAEATNFFARNHVRETQRWQTVRRTIQRTVYAQWIFRIFFTLSHASRAVSQHVTFAGVPLCKLPGSRKPLVLANHTHLPTFNGA